MAGTLQIPFYVPYFWELFVVEHFFWETAPVFLSLQMNRTKGDEEEYWNSSKFKAFTFDDEDDELSQVGFHKC